MKKALLAVTSYHETFYPNGQKTGIYASSAIQAYKLYTLKGYDVDFVSETGTYGFDECSLRYEHLNGEDLIVYSCENSSFNQALKNIKRPSEIDPRDYQIFFATSGYGCLYDYPHSQIAKIAARIYEQGGVVSAICHGQVLFDGLLDSTTGEYILQGKSMTGFTDLGNKLLQMYDVLIEKKLLTMQSVAERNGAKFLSPVGPFDDFSIADGRLVTGVNAKSVVSTALRTLSVIRELKLNRVQ